MSALARSVGLQALGVVGGSIVGAVSAHLFLAEWLLARAGRALGGRPLFVRHPDELKWVLTSIVLGVGVAPWCAVPALIVEHLGGRRPAWWVGPIALATVWLGVALALARRISWMAAALSETPDNGMSLEVTVTMSSLELGWAAAWGAVLAGGALTAVAIVRLRRHTRRVAVSSPRGQSAPSDG